MLLKPLLDVNEPAVEIHIYCPVDEEDFGLLAIASALISDHRSRVILYLDDPLGFAHRYDHGLREIVEHYGLNCYLLTKRADAFGCVKFVFGGRMVSISEVQQDKKLVVSWLSIAHSPIMKALCPHLPASVLPYIASLMEWANSAPTAKGQ